MSLSRLALITVGVFSLSVVTLASSFTHWDAPGTGSTSWTAFAAFATADVDGETTRRNPSASAALGFGTVVAGAAAAPGVTRALASATAVWRPGPQGPTDRLSHQSTLAAHAASRASVSASLRATSPAWAGLPFAGRRGALRRPVTGWVYHEYGPIPARDLETNLRHRGVTYSVEPGAIARAVAPAIVAFAGEVDGHGQVVILSHGDGFHTVYAFLDQLSVEQNAVVGDRDPVGQTGPDSPHRGRRLHFQIRRYSDALDPAAWITRRGVVHTAARSSHH